MQELGGNPGTENFYNCTLSGLSKNFFLNHLIVTNQASCSNGQTQGKGHTVAASLGSLKEAASAMSFPPAMVQGLRSSTQEISSRGSRVSSGTGDMAPQDLSWAQVLKAGGR